MKRIPLEVDPELLHQLRLFRAQLGRGGDPRIATADVERVEFELSCGIPAELLAFFAMVELDVGLITELTETLREEGMHRKLIAFAADEDGFHWCWHPDQTLLTTHPAGESARNTLAAVTRRLRIQDARRRDIEPATVPTDARPYLVQTPERWVEHPIFGKGRVVKEVLGTHPAVEVEFPDGQRRRLLTIRVRGV